MPYRGGTREWSNRFHFGTATPADGAHWTTFSDAVVAAEKAIFLSDVTIVKAYGMAAGSDVPIFTKTYSVAGTGGFAGTVGTPGEVAALIRWSTADRSTKNHPIYAFSYMHGAHVSSGGPWDTMNSAQVTAMSTYATAWVTGFSDGSNTLKRYTPGGHLATGQYVNPLLTHRDFPRG